MDPLEELEELLRKVPSIQDRAIETGDFAELKATIKKLERLRKKLENEGEEWKA